MLPIIIELIPSTFGLTTPMIVAASSEDVDALTLFPSNTTVLPTAIALPSFVSNGYELIRLYLLKPLKSEDFQPTIR